MSFFTRFPYTNFNNLNLDWMIERVKAASDMADTVEDRLTAVETVAATASSTASAAATTANSAAATANTNASAISAASTGRLSRYNPGGRDLIAVFGSMAALHTAVSAGDFSNIFPGDYITLPIAGTLHDYASDTDLTLNTTMVFEVAALDYYYNTGNSAYTTHHLVMMARNAIPQALKMRSANNTEYNTEEVGLFRRSALFETLNNSENGFLSILNTTDAAPYIQSGGAPTRVGVWAAGDASPSTTSWTSTGSVFIPNVYQICGSDIQLALPYLELSNNYNQFELLAATVGRGVKNAGDNSSSRVNWWLNAFFGAYGFTYVMHKYGFCYRYPDAQAAVFCAPCFLFV